MRSIWNGEISFGVVTIPVKLYSASKDLTPSFHQLHKDCGSRISLVRRCDACNKDLAWEEISKGYEVEKGKYALFSKEELAELDGENQATGIDILEFIDLHEVDLALIDKNYWAGSGGKSSLGYKLLHQALSEMSLVALARVKIRTRTRLGILRPKDQVFALDTLRFGDELIGSSEVPVQDSLKQPTEREIKLARTLVQSMTAKFDPGKHVDTYRIAVASAAEGKSGSLKTETGSSGKMLDLGDLLEASLKGSQK